MSKTIGVSRTLLCALALSLSCTPKGPQSDSTAPTAETDTEAVPVPGAETETEAEAETEVEVEAEAEAEAETEAPEPPEEHPAPPALDAPAEPSAQPDATRVAAKKRYRRGGSKVRKGTRAVELSNTVDAKGRRFTLESHFAPVLVLTFGASWCAPCKKELPALEKLAQGYGKGEVDFVAVNIDSTIATGKAFMKRSGLKRVEAVYDPKSSSVGSYDPPTLPSVFIVKEGIVRHVHAGYRSGDASQLKKVIDRELK